jgi:hypothetical protein
MQILHRFVGSIQRYSKELSDPDRYRPHPCLGVKLIVL